MNNNYRLNSQYSFTKILIIEDVNYAKRLLKKDLKDIGYFVLTASNTEEAVDKIDKYTPDIITISHGLRDIPLSKLVQKFKSISDAKILFISTRTDTDILTKEISLHIDTVVSLPIEKDKLANIILELISKE